MNKSSLEYVILRVIHLAKLVTLDLGSLIFRCKAESMKICFVFGECVVLKLSVDLNQQMLLVTGHIAGCH